MMKQSQIITLLFCLLTILLFQCKQRGYTSQECKPVMVKLLEAESQIAPPDQLEQVKSLESSLLPMMEKECMSGDYELECLKQASSFESVQSCRKK